MSLLFCAFTALTFETSLQHDVRWHSISNEGGRGPPYLDIHSPGRAEELYPYIAYNERTELWKIYYENSCSMLRPKIQRQPEPDGRVIVHEIDVVIYQDARTVTRPRDGA